MQIHLSADFCSQNTFYPCYTPHGQLIAVELNTRFVHETAGVTLPQEMLLPQLSTSQRIALLQDQLSLLENNNDFFALHNIKATVMADDCLVKLILNNDLLGHRIRQLPWLELQISEDFPGLECGKNNAELIALKAMSTLCLGNFGAGKAPANALYDDLFQRVKLDKNFLRSVAKRGSFSSFIKAIFENVAPHCECVVLQGIDEKKLLNKVLPFNPGGMQGTIFPGVNVSELNALMEFPAILHSHR